MPTSQWCPLETWMTTMMVRFQHPCPKVCLKISQGHACLPFCLPCHHERSLPPFSCGSRRTPLLWNISGQAGKHHLLHGTKKPFTLATSSWSPNLRKNQLHRQLPCHLLYVFRCKITS